MGAICLETLRARHHVALTAWAAAADKLLALPRSDRAARVEWQLIAEACRREYRRLGRHVLKIPARREVHQ